MHVCVAVQTAGFCFNSEIKGCSVLYTLQPLISILHFISLLFSPSSSTNMFPVTLPIRKHSPYSTWTCTYSGIRSACLAKGGCPNRIIIIINILAGWWWMNVTRQFYPNVMQHVLPNILRGRCLTPTASLACLLPGAIPFFGPCLCVCARSIETHISSAELIY